MSATPVDIDISDITDESEPAPLPPPPRINGVPADTWALGIERKIDSILEVQREALTQIAESLAAVQRDNRQDFDRILDTLKAIERHEQMLSDDRADISALDSKVNALRDRVDRLERATTKRPRRKK